MATTKAKTETKETIATVQASNTKKLDMEGRIKQKTSFIKKKDIFFESVGVIGWNKISTGMVASILTGIPILFIGEAGLGKTFACKQIMRYLILGVENKMALNSALSIIDASKVDWEELVGPYNLKSYEVGKIEYLSTPMSLWKKRGLFIDEITRSSDKVQNGMLELTREKELQGMPTDLELVWAASNPLTHEGTQTLNEALSDRFGMVLDIPNLLELGEENLRKVLDQGSSADDKVLSKYLPKSYKKLEDQYAIQKEQFVEYLKAVGERYVKVMGKLDIKEYVAVLGRAYQSNLKKGKKGDSVNPFTLETRRIQYLKTLITATLAVELTEYELYIASLPKADRKAKEMTSHEMTSWMHGIIYKTLEWNENTQISGKSLNETALQEAHTLALKVIDAKDWGVKEMLDIKSEPDQTKKFFKCIAALDTQPLEIHNVFTEIENSFELNEENEFGTKHVDKDLILNGYDTFLPTLFLTAKSSPMRHYLDKLEPEMVDKMTTFQQFAYQARLLETPQDFVDWTPTIQEHLGKVTIVDELNDKTPYEKTVTKEILALGKEEQFLRDIVFRRLLTCEGVYARIALSLGEREKITDKKSDAWKKEDEICAKVVANDILPYFQAIDYKVRKEWAKIKEVVEDYGIELKYPF